jgi:hypothetical protein
MMGIEMTILRIEHQVPSFDKWKEAFDSDPIGRRQGGVRRYQIMRPVDDPSYVMVDLEFDSVSEAEAFLGDLRKLWAHVAGTIMQNPRTRLIEVAEREEY